MEALNDGECWDNIFGFLSYGGRFASKEQLAWHRQVRKVWRCAAPLCRKVLHLFDERENLKREARSSPGTSPLRRPDSPLGRGT